jgi:hypothetical protein
MQPANDSDDDFFCWQCPLCRFRVWSDAEVVARIALQHAFARHLSPVLFWVVLVIVLPFILLLRILA